MTAARPMRIALLTHSTNPRGGVMHVLQLAQALTDLGHHVVVHAPDPQNRGFARALRCGVASVPAAACVGPLAQLVKQRIDEYIDYFRSDAAGTFDLYHAHDGISGCALAALRDSGHISAFTRTVHHLDHFDDPYLNRCQDLSIVAATQVLCVSWLWASELSRRYVIPTKQVPNGVDLNRFTPTPDRHDRDVRAQFGIRPENPVFLSIGGVEMRKNTVRLLEAFTRVIRKKPGARLLIAGGASLLNHSEYRRSFDAALAASGLSIGREVVLTGPIPDDQMPALMRCATVLVFPSLIEGFGLVVLEAMASGTPVVVSKIEPFTEYLTEPDCAWADPLDLDSIATAMLHTCEPAIADAYRHRGFAVAQRFPWSRSAQIHEAIYSQLIEGGPHAGNAISSSLA